MKKTENYMQDGLLILVVTILSLFTSSLPYICLLLCGAIMVILTLRSLADNEKPAEIIMLFLTSSLAVVSGWPFGFLLLCSCRLFRFSEIILPSLFCMIYVFAFEKKSIAEAVFFFLVIALCSLVLHFAEKLILSYFSAVNRISQAVSVTAVNELYQKKLNHELTVRNYISDKAARLEERENISRNIHNSVGHTITAAVMTLAAADMLFDAAPERAREKMNTANDRIRESLGAIRHAVRVLDSETQYVYVEDLIRELDNIIDSFSMDTTIDIISDYSDAPPYLRIPHEHNEFLCGALQEFLSNGVRHGGADHFTVSISAYSGNICLRVTDNGKSDYSPDNSEFLIKNGFGLKKIISYSEKCGGSARFVNDHGFNSVIKLPIYEEDKQ